MPPVMPWTIRPVQPNDFPSLTALVADAWDLASLCGSAADGQIFAARYLRYCLAESTFAAAACLDRRLAGFVLARADGAAPLPLPPEENRPFAGEKARALWTSMEDYAARCDALRRSAPLPFEGELTLFIVHHTLRGRGAGTALYDAARAYFRRARVRRFFLYTDSTCTWSFYEGKHLARLGRAAMANPADPPRPLSIFLYGGAP